MDTNDQIKVEVNDIDLEDRQPSPIEPASRALSDGSREESPNYKQHTWTVEQRLTLNMLGRYSNNWNDKTAVFNRFHKSELRNHGGLRRAVVNTQFNDMRRKFDPVAALKKLQATLSPYDRMRLATHAALERKADEIGIRLNAKRPTDDSGLGMLSDTHNGQRHKRKRADLIDEARTDYLSDRSINRSQTPLPLQTTHEPYLLAPPKTPTKNHGQQRNDGLLTPPDSGVRKLDRLTADKRLAPLGFRAFTAESQGTYSSILGIRAGAFVDRPTIPLAKDLDVTSYRREALHHITKHDHTRPSMFVSATKNPIRALHMAIRGGEASSIAVISLHEADKNGNVQKAFDLKLETEWRYTAAGEYLIFGGVDPQAIISHIPLSKLMANMPITPQSNDPFCLKVLQAEEKLSRARRAIKKDAHPMTFSLGRAVGELVGILGIPPKFFECGVWSLCQDYKFYNAEGGRRRGHWSLNSAFRDGALQGYQAHSGMLATLGNTMSARNIIEIIDDSESDLDSSDADDHIPVGVEEWIRDTEASQSSMQYFDSERNKWTTKDNDLSDDFFQELRKMAENEDVNGPGTQADEMIEDTMYVSEAGRQDESSNMAFNGQHINTDAVIEGGVATSLNGLPREGQNLNELLADVLRMHGEPRNSELDEDKDTKYEYCWTGM